MKQEVKISMKLFAFIMALLMLLVSLPISAFASAINDALSDENNVISNADSETVKKDVIVLEEDETLRDENIKHFKLSDGTTKAVVYSQAVHYKDADGNWVDIDNALTLNGSEYSSNNKSEIKFANKSGSTGLVSIKDGDYKIDFTPLNTNKVSVVIENPQSNNSRKFEDMSVLNNLVSKAIYADIYDGIDIEYILVGNNIKENIIVKEKQDSYTFSFELKLNKLSAELVNGAIILSDYDSGEQVYEIPVPYMYDANNVYSDSVEYSLVQNNKWKYTFTVTADAGWINADDRAFPVVIDPAIGISRNNIVCFYETEGYVTQGGMVMHAGELSKIYFKLSTLPELPNSAYITDANIKMYCNSGFDTYIGAYEILNDWSSSTIKPSTVNSVGIFANSPVDYVYIEDAAEWDKQLCTWNIVDVVRGWYSNSNYGVGFDTVNNTYTSATFSSMTYDTISCRPFISIEYRDMKGVESYWSYVSQNVGSAGSGVINLATGNLMFEISTLTTTENIFGFTPSMIYNSAIAGEDYKYGSVENGYWYSFAATGFKLNMNETLIKRSYINENNETAYYYVWADADGTEHYFLPSTVENEENIYYDEDGLQLKLVVDLVDDNEETYCKIVDSAHNERIFYILGGAPASEGLAVYHLEQLKDRNGNILHFEMDGAHKPNNIRFTPSGTTQKTQLLGPLYNTDKKVALIWCNETKEGVLFRHSSTPTGELHPTGGTYLREALYLKCDSNISWKNVLNEFVSDADNEYDGITVKGIMKYEYNQEGYLISAHDTLSGYKVNYAYSNGKVILINESIEISGQAPVSGQTIGISYYVGYTEVRTSGSDDEYGTSDDLINVYVFDKEGRSTSVYTTDVTRSEIYGATTGQYEDEVEEAKNNIKVSSVTGMTYANYLLNGNFEYNDTEAAFWTTSGNTSFYVSEYDEGWNNARLSLVVGANENASISQVVQLTAGEYTLSLDINTFDSENVTIYLKATSETEEYIEELPVNEYYASGSDGFATFNFEVKSEEISDFTIGVYVIGNEQIEKSNFIAIDNLCLSKSSGSSIYNLIHFSTFENYNNNSISDSNWKWVTNSNEEFWINDEDNDYADGQKFGNSIKINGKIGSEITVKQELYKASQKALNTFSNPSTYGRGSTGEEKIFILSGFGKATESMKNSKSVFALRLDVTYMETGVEYEFKTESTYAYFVPGNDAWQYTSATFILPKGSMVKDITVHCEYSNNEGTAYFDNLSLTCEESSNTTQYYYYEEGKNAGKVMAEVSGLSDLVYYVYDDNGNTIEVITRRDRTTYTYDERNNVVSSQYYKHNVYPPFLAGYDAVLEKFEKNKDKIKLKTTTTYTYDYSDDIDNNGEYGLLLCEKTVENGSSEYTQTKYEYETSITSKIFGALKKITNSLGKSTQYFYDNKTGRLLSTIEADGTGYCYTYDNIGNMIAVEPATLTSSTPTAVENSTDVQYVYNSQNQLSQIIANGTTYSFTYDDFGNKESIIIGNSEIVKQEYNSYNGKIAKIIYGNGTEINYEYDNVNRVTKKSYITVEKTTEYQYKYDSNGNLSKLIDGGSNTTTIYKYDNAGRLVKTIEYDNETMKNLNGVSYSYDQDSNISFLWYDQDYLYDSIEYGRLYQYYSYNYDDADGSLTSVSININGYPNTINAVLNYAYDGFGRYTSKTIATSGGTNTTTFGYLTTNSATSSLVSQYTSTIIKDEIVKYNKTFNYVYDDANENIVEVRDDSNSIIYRYDYDSLDRLIREDNSELGKTFVYTYDDNGNILSEKVYSYTLNDVLSLNPENTYEYSYDNEDWKDQLTSYMGGTITYDEIGNPLLYWNGMQFEWDNVNNLSKLSWGDNNISYTYDENGIRTSKIINGITHAYVVDGTKIISETYGNVLLTFIYDEKNTPIGILYRENSYEEGKFDEYYFTKNLQGDIIGIYDVTGAIVASYAYDAWGNHFVYNATGEIVEEEQTNFIGNINPFRYRGYYYDTESDFYFLNARYYDPEVKRFINADTKISSVGGDINGYNLYSYCFNNPIKYDDSMGTWPKWLENVVKAVVVVAVVVSAVAVVTATGGAAAVVAGVALGTASGALVGGIANEAKGESFINGAAGGAVNGLVQSVGGALAPGIGTIVGGGVGSGLGTCLTENLNNIGKPIEEQKSSADIATSSLKSAAIGAAFSTLTAGINYSVDYAVHNQAYGLMPEMTYGFGEMMKGFFSSVDDAMVYILSGD